MVDGSGAVGLDQVTVVFDDERVVTDAGIVLVATLAARLGVEALVDRVVRLPSDRPGAGRAGRKLMTLVFAMLLGADCIDDCDVVRSGRTRRLLGGWVAAPSTIGTFLRAFTFGHVRQLDRVLAETLTRAWRAGAGPGQGRLVIDIDSFVGEVYGHRKQGAAFGYTRKRGYHPLLASRADTQEVLHVRLRKGSANSQRGILRFLDELIARIGRAGADGSVLVRADSGFWNLNAFKRLEEAGWKYSIGLRMTPPIQRIVALIPEHAWQPVPGYPASGVAEIAETTWQTRRLIVRRVRTLSAQAELFPDWKHYPFATNRTEAIVTVEAEHRQHAVVELVIRDLKDQALAHFPSGRFNANSAWTVTACLAHNLLRWTQTLALPQTLGRPRTARTLRRRLLQIPGRLTRHAGRWTLHLPARWPWQHAFIEALERIRTLPAA